MFGEAGFESPDRGPRRGIAFQSADELFNNNGHEPGFTRDGGIMKIFIALAAAFLLSGCGLPPAFTFVSYALDGMTLLSTGKSVGDHAISAAAEKDCAVWRVVKDEDVCREYRDGEKSLLVAAAERWERGGEIVGRTELEYFVPREPAPEPVLLAVVDPVVLPQFADDDDAAPPRIGVGQADGGLGIRMPKGPIDDPFITIAPAKAAWCCPRSSAANPPAVFRR